MADGASESDRLTRPSDGDANVCARCADQGPTCCHSPTGVSLAPLTDGDVTRIARHTGLVPQQFTMSRRIDEEERQAWREEDPAVDAWVGPDRMLRTLAIRERQCVFLGDTGCTLPRSIRPLECLRFPFVKRGRIIEAHPAGDCLACDEAEDIDGLMELLGIDRKTLAQLDRRFRRAAKRKQTQP